MFIIDWTVNVGTLLTVFCGIIAIYISVKSDLIGIKKDVKRLEEAFKQLSSVLTTVAVQGSRIDMLERSIYELRHGQGFINKLNDN